MSVLLREIQQINREAASVLEKADLRTDSEIQSLTRDELHELFPTVKNFKLRRTIFRIIHKEKPVEELLRKLKQLIPNENLRGALTYNGVLVDDLQILRDMKDQVNHVQSFLEAHINVLESSSKAQPDQEPYTGREDNRTSKGDEGSNRAMTRQKSQAGKEENEIKPNVTRLRAQDVLSAAVGMFWDLGASASSASFGWKQSTKRKAADSPQQAHETLKYKMVVSGKTFGAHLQLLDKIQNSLQFHSVKLEETQNSEDYQIVIVFCPIVSRSTTDVNEAMREVKGEKPVILVLMHHSHEAKPTTSRKAWDGNHILLHVDVFYHDTKHGLLNCSQNEDAASAIGKELMKHCSRAFQDANENSMNMGGGHYQLT
ncbi:uncharacterized protein PAE49_002410 isoform 2-T3 [Odontesthes bonariensis]|uniref:uncharacterized protein LOC142375435 isoform X2 n=1 Tax=Odontesthes bonariensis TaxID=219752 RepID=UPI003F584D2A